MSDIASISLEYLLGYSCRSTSTHHTSHITYHTYIMKSFLAITVVLSLLGAVTCEEDLLRGNAANKSNKQQARKTEETTNTKGKPNILFIPVDDLNNWLGYTGANPQSKTPNFDRLAKMGVAFTNAHASSTICNPSRAAVWSGTRPSTTGCYDNRDHPWTRYIGEGLGLNAHFKNNGYYAAGRGKTYHSSQGGNSKEDWKRKATVYPDEWDKYPKAENDYPVKPHYLDGFTQDYPKNAHKKFDDKSDPDWHTVDFCEKMLMGADERDEPLFLACGIVKPHLPWVVPKKYYDMYPKDQIIMPGGFADETQRKRDLKDVPKPGVDLAHPDKEFLNVTKLDRELDAIQAYLATIAYADMNIGRLIDAYERSPEKDNTIVVLWSDHGYHLGQKQHWKKQTLWEEASDVPFIWIVPNVTTPGTVSTRPVDLQSIYPTLCDLAGLPIPEHVDGANIRPLLENPEAEWDGVALTTMRYKNHAIRDERYRYIRYYDGSEELYDHKFDPHEFDNLAKEDEYEPIKERLRTYLPKVNMKIWYDGQTCTDGDKQHIMTCPDGIHKVARDPNKGCKYMKCPEFEAEDDDDEEWNEDYDPRPDEESPDDGEEAEFDETVDDDDDDDEEEVDAVVDEEDDEEEKIPFPVTSAISSKNCREQKDTVFNNARGKPRVCEWLTRKNGRVEVECTKGLGLATDADKACPISCKKCTPEKVAVSINNDEEEKKPEQVDAPAEQIVKCAEARLAEFTNARGQTRNCKWLTKAGDRIQNECGTVGRGGPLPDAAVKCPITCQRC